MNQKNIFLERVYTKGKLYTKADVVVVLGLHSHYILFGPV